MRLYTSSISKYLNVEQSHIHLFWKGRVALYAALKAAGVKSGDEVIIPGLTCVVVPNSILYCGAIPVYADVRPDTLTLDLNSVANLINEKTKVLIIQNTFGLSADVDTLVNIARVNNILVLEDCTHGFGGYFDGYPNGTLADASFFSTQWSKPYSTGLGGILLVNHPDQFPGLENVNLGLITPNKIELASLYLSIQVRRFLLTDNTYWYLLRLYRWLSKVGLVTGSSTADEIESTVMPSDFFKNYSGMQSRAGLRELKDLREVIAIRKKSAISYRQTLAANNKWYISSEYDDNNSHLKFPILVHDRKLFLDAAEKVNVRVSDWFISPIHPVETRFSDWKLQVETIPNAYAISKKLLTVNTEVHKVDRVCKFLSENMELIA